MNDFYIGQHVLDLHGDLAVVRGFGDKTLRLHMLECRCQYQHVNGVNNMPEEYFSPYIRATPTAPVIHEDDEVNIP